MKRFLFLFIALAFALSSFAQFADTVELNAYIRDTIKDRRPEKVTAAQIQKALLGVSQFAGGKDYDNTIDSLRNLCSRVEFVSNISQFRSMAVDPDTAVLYKILSGKVTGEFYYIPGDVTTPDDGVVNIRTAGAKLLTRVIDGAIYPEWWGATGTPGVDDSPAFQAMFNWVGAGVNRQFVVRHRSREYLLNDTIVIPSGTVFLNQMRRLKIEGNGVLYKKTTAGPMFYRRPVDQSDALNIMIGSISLTFEGINMIGNSIAGQRAIDISALYSPKISECSFSQFDTAVVATFWLNPNIDNNFFTVNMNVAFKGASGEGYWAGATTSNAAFNAANFRGNRIFNASGSWAGLLFLATDGVSVRDHISEGFNPRYDIFNDSQASTVVNNNSYENIWFESVGGINGSLNTAFYLRNNGSTLIKTIQNDYQDTIAKFANPGAGSHFSFQNLAYWPKAGKLFDAGGIFNSGSQLEVSNTPFFIGEIFSDSTYWVGGVVGFENTDIRRGEILTTNQSITLRPNHNSAATNRHVNIDGNFLSVSDNEPNISLGGNSSGGIMQRFHTGWFGDGGVYASNSGHFAFGNATTTPDYMYRVNTGRIGFNGTGAINLPNGTTSNRAATAGAGDIRYNADSVGAELRTGVSWETIATRQYLRLNQFVQEYNGYMVLKAANGGPTLGIQFRDATDFVLGVINQNTNTGDLHIAAKSQSGSSYLSSNFDQENFTIFRNKADIYPALTINQLSGTDKILDIQNSGVSKITFDVTDKLTVAGSISAESIAVDSVTPTGSADATGVTGNITFDVDYIYIKTSAGWKRAALSTF